jgi:hypothetical protein
MLYEAEAEIAFSAIPSYVKVPVIKSIFSTVKNLSSNECPVSAVFIGKNFLDYPFDVISITHSQFVLNIKH